MAQISLELDLNDKDHQALDEIVVKSFQVNYKYKEDPDWPTLLFFIVNQDKRLSSISWEGVKGLLQRESFLMGVLQKGWSDCSFREVRRLGMSPYSFPSDYRH